jgi:hypothetical protein
MCSSYLPSGVPNELYLQAINSRIASADSVPEGLLAFTEAAHGDTRITKAATQQLMAALTTPSAAKSTMLGEKGEKYLVVASTSM